MKKILVVEDTLSVREEICDILRIEDYEVFEASDGYQALAIVKNKMPDLIITDILMPRLNGFKLIKELKRLKRARNIPIILLTAKAEKSDLQHGLELGVKDYLVKPLSILDLIKAVRNKFLNKNNISSKTPKKN
ncbi:MAG: response regulator [Bacteroidales bacterium]|nr:response regulator [Bacteroidales bacterium]